MQHYGSAASSVVLNSIQVDGNFEITTQSGENFLATIDSTFGGTFTANLLESDDFVSASNSLFNGVVTILGGNGVDTFEDLGGNTFTIAPPNLDVETLI